MTATTTDSAFELLKSSYTDCHKSIDMIHDRMDRVSQNYFLAIGAVYALFFTGPSNSAIITAIVPILSVFALMQLSGMNYAIKKICEIQSYIEKKYNVNFLNEQNAENSNNPDEVATYGNNDTKKLLSEGPAQIALNKFYKEDFVFSRRGLIWCTISIASTVLFLMFVTDFIPKEYLAKT